MLKFKSWNEYEHTWSNFSSEIQSILSHFSRCHIVHNSQKMRTRTEWKLVNWIEWYITCNWEQNAELLQFYDLYNISLTGWSWPTIKWTSSNVYLSIRWRATKCYKSQVLYLETKQFHLYSSKERRQCYIMTSWFHGRGSFYGRRV